MELVSVEYLRSNHVDDIFKGKFADGSIDYFTFPRSMDMNPLSVMEFYE